MADSRPIGLFDSGVGGLTVLREVVRRLPAESTLYLGDNARAPYGPRSDDEVRRFSTECLDELAARDVKAIVVAASSSRHSVEKRRTSSSERGPYGARALSPR